MCSARSRAEKRGRTATSTCSSKYEPGHGGFAFVDFCEAVERLLRRRVDVVTERSLHPLVRDRVLAQAVPL